jgi:hypothetical protein
MKSKWLLRSENAGALPMVVGMSLVIVSISASLLLAGYYFRIRNIRLESREIVQRNLVSAIDLFLGIKDNLAFNEGYAFDLFNFQTDSVVLYKQLWGFFELGIIKSSSNIYSDSVAILVGGEPQGVNTSTLYLVDNRRPLSIAGDTRLSGDVYLPSTGVKAAYINRIGFTGKRFVNGEVFTSSNAMPEINSRCIKMIEQFYEDPSGIRMEDTDELSDTLFQSFLSAKPMLFQSSDSLVMDKFVMGNIIIKSSKALFVKQNATIQNAILMAPHIYIEEGFNGYGQFISNETIILENHVTLNYPSVIAVLGNTKPTVIEIGTGSEVAGFLFQFSIDQNYENSKLHLKEDCKFNGLAYIDGFVDLLGDFNGHLSCQKFLISINSSVYENHLYNVTIKNDLTEKFISPVLFKSKNYDIISYLE